MRYADPIALYNLLGIDPDNPEPEGVLEHLEQVEEGIAANIDSKCNCTFGSEPVQVTREVAYGSYAVNNYAYIDRIYLDSGMVFFLDSLIPTTTTSPYITEYGMRNVTGVFVNGTWDGTVWDDEDEIAVEDWRLVFTRHDGWSMGILLPSFGYSSVRVTAEWEDLSKQEEIPPDVREAATFLTADQYRILTQSPNGEIGAPGLVTYIRNTWEHVSVTETIRRHKVWPLVV